MLFKSPHPDIAIPDIVVHRFVLARAAALGDKPALLDAATGRTPFATLLETAASAPRAPVDPARDLAVLPYSSGTTGFPKGVVLTHRNLVANLLQTASVHHVAEQDRIIAVLPFFRIYGMQV